ncbi:MAG TPA: TrkA C-terminal domain-containing protein, partial [Adhaeribacter sp.]|nr:TrkA C-terminal domain-containing protein [Adhaeribacter sp.]
DLFGAVFFVSVGMLIDPKMLVEYAGPVLIITLVTIAGKVISSTVGALISGQPLKQSIQAGMSLAQIGEFSFIIATLGLTLKVTSEFLYPIAVAVSAITTFTTPFMIKASEPFYNWLEKLLPERIKATLNNYSTASQTISSTSDWKQVLRSFAQIVVVNTVVLVGIILLSSRFLAPLVLTTISASSWGRLLTAVITLLAMAPFIWALSLKSINTEAYANLRKRKKATRGPLIALETARVVLAVILVGLLLTKLFSATIAFLVAFILIIVVSSLFAQRLNQTYETIERRFLFNLNARDLEERSVKKLVPWDAHIAHFEVSPEATAVGKTLIELALREKFGVNLAQIERGRLVLQIPSGHERLYPGDKITVIGTDEQLERFKPVVESMLAGVEPDRKDGDITLKQLVVDRNFPFLGKNIIESGIREKTKGLIIGIERKGQRILNPDPATVFQLGDLIWLAGNEEKIAGLLRPRFP